MLLMVCYYNTTWPDAILGPCPPKQQVLQRLAAVCYWLDHCELSDMFHDLNNNIP
jgi:hypothetical protein